jgi:hypothetical protein
MPTTACASGELQMALVTLQRLAPVAPGASKCRLCDAPIGGRLQDNLLVGQPGTAEVRAVLCSGCGDVLTRLVEVCGPQMSILIKGEQPAQNHAEPTELEQTRQRLSHEAEVLKSSAQTLRGEAEKLGHLDTSG